MQYLCSQPTGFALFTPTVSTSAPTPCAALMSLPPSGRPRDSMWLVGTLAFLSYSVQKADISPTARADYFRCRNATMVPAYNCMVARSAVRYINTEHIEGDIVEMGVWAGGSSCMMALAQMQYQTSPRRMWLFDTFEGMPQPTSKDDSRSRRLWKAVNSGSITKVPGTARDRKWAFSPLSDVQATMARTGYPNVTYVKGKVEDTLRNSSLNLPTKIALLRLDTDWYASTKVELEVLWSRLVPGGWLYVDDYSAFGGAKRAVDEWIHSNTWLRQARRALAYKQGRVAPRGPGDDGLGSFQVVKARPYSTEKPFDDSNETLRALCPVCLPL